MAKYSSFKYSGQKYGSTWVYDERVTWIVLVDWDNDGVYDGANEGDYLIGMDIARGTEHYISPTGDGFEHMRPGRATLTFDDASGRYDPRNTSSPLYPNVKPGRKIRIQAYDHRDEGTYVLFTGIIDQIDPRGYRKEIDIICVDYMQWLADQTLTFQAELLNTTITGAINHLLDQAQYPGARNLQTDDQPIWVFTANEQNALRVAHQVADAGLGIFWVDEYGQARYQKRNHPTSGVNVDQSIFSRDIRVSNPWDGVYNDITVTAMRYVKMQPSIIYSLTEAIYIANNGTVDVAVNYDPSTDAQVGSVEGNTRPDGEGTAKTMRISAANLGLTGGTVTVSNQSGANAYLTKLEIRGRKYAATRQEYNAGDMTSQQSYGLRRFRLSSPFLQDRNYAGSFATILKNFLKDDRASLIVQMRGSPSYKQLYNTLMHFVNFSSATLGIPSTVYQILGLHHQWRRGAQDLLSTWHLHRVLVDTTSITPSALESAPRVPQAPSGYDDPSGDPDTVTSAPELTEHGNTYFVRLIPRYNGYIDELSDLEAGEFLQFSSFKASDDVTGNIIDNYINVITPPGVYLLTYSVNVRYGPTVPTGKAFRTCVKVYNSAGVLRDDTPAQMVSDNPPGEINNLRDETKNVTCTILLADPFMAYFRISFYGSSDPYFNGSDYFVWDVPYVYLYRISRQIVDLI